MAAGKNLDWQDFETEVAQHIEEAVEAEATAYNRKHCKVHRRRSYHSRDRDADIEFDVVVEAIEPGATEPSARWIIECKDYATRKVPVDDVEEFIQKLDQIGPGNVRGSMVTRVGFQKSALRVAASRRIGLFTLKKKLVRVLCFDAKGSSYECVEFSCDFGLMSSGKVITPQQSWTLAMLAQVEMRHSGILPPLP